MGVASPKAAVSHSTHGTAAYHFEPRSGRLGSRPQASRARSPYRKPVWMSRKRMAERVAVAGATAAEEAATEAATEAAVEAATMAAGAETRVQATVAAAAAARCAAGAGAAAARGQGLTVDQINQNFKEPDR